MAYIITWWADPQVKHNPDDYNEIEHIQIKSVVERDMLIANRPKNCTAISQEYSAPHRVRGKISCPDNPRRFKFIWTR